MTGDGWKKTESKPETETSETPVKKGGGWGVNWLNRLRPKLKAWSKKADFPVNLWETCGSCGQLLHHQELKDSLRACKLCGHHLHMDPIERFDSLFDQGQYELMPSPTVTTDPLKFRGT